MKVIGLTGGIGAGKSTVAKIFKTLGIPVYDSDTRAKQLYTENSGLQSKMKSHFGEDIYVDGNIDRVKLATIVFKDKAELSVLNSFVHPVLAQDFIGWKIRQNTSYVIREAAILVESNAYRDCAAVIVVTAPLDVRLARVVKRDQSNEEMVKQRMANQMSQDELLTYGDHQVINDGNTSLIKQVLKIHSQLV